MALINPPPHALPCLLLLVLNCLSDSAMDTSGCFTVLPAMTAVAATAAPHLPHHLRPPRRGVKVGTVGGDMFRCRSRSPAVAEGLRKHAVS